MAARWHLPHVRTGRMWGLEGVLRLERWEPPLLLGAPFATLESLAIPRAEITQSVGTE